MGLPHIKKDDFNWQTLFITKMAKIDTLLMTKAAENLAFRVAHTYIVHYFKGVPNGSINMFEYKNYKFPIHLFSVTFNWYKFVVHARCSFCFPLQGEIQGQGQNIQ